MNIAWDPFLTKSSEPDPMLSRPAPPRASATEVLMTQSRPVPPPRPEASQRRDDGSSNVAWDPFLTKNRRGPDPEGPGPQPGPLRGFRCKHERAIGIRVGPSVDADRTGDMITPGEFFMVSEVCGDRGQRFLKLSDGRGWVFTLSHVDGSVIAQESPSDWDSELDPFMSKGGAAGTTTAAVGPPRATVATPHAQAPAGPSAGKGAAASLLSRAGGPKASSMAGDSFYGSTQFPPPLKQGKAGLGLGGISGGLSGSQLLGLSLPPWLLFTSLECVFAFLPQAFGECRVLLGGLLLSCCLLGLLVFTLGRIRRRSYQATLGLVTIVASFAGSATGAGVYARLVHAGVKADGGAIYENVSPEESSSSRADASAIYFTEGAFVDAQRSLGYRAEGVNYCVAPITTRERGTRASPEYWAIGQDCCAARGVFWCGDLRSSSGGTIIATGPGTRGANYVAAAHMARVFFDLGPGQDGQASFVHMISEMDLYVDYVCPVAFTICACSLIFLIVSILAAPQLSRFLRQAGAPSN